jgi:hypothetical protein
MDEVLSGSISPESASSKRNTNWPAKIGVALLSTIPDVFHVREVEIDSANERQAVLKL